MKSFRQYLSEILNPSKVDVKSHPDLAQESALSRAYIYEPKDESGKLIRHGVIRTYFDRYHPESHKWNIHFTVGGSHGWLPTQDFPSDVTKRVFDHIQHHIARHREETGKSPTFIYDTTHPKKERIYRAGAKRLGVKILNTNVLDADLDRGARRWQGFVLPDQEEDEEL